MKVGETAEKMAECWVAQMVEMLAVTMVEHLVDKKAALLELLLAALMVESLAGWWVVPTVVLLAVS